MFKKIYFIINPGTGGETPILTYLNNSLKDSPIEWDVSVTNKIGDAKKIAIDLKDKVDCVIACGGDGTVTEVAQALFQTDTPMGVIPTGTANVLSKELNISQDIVQAIEILKNPVIKKVDMGLLQNMPFLIRVNFGAWADMIKNTDRSLKDSLGQLAYGVSAINQITTSQQSHYDMIIDDEKVSIDGASLFVNNAGNVGIPGLSLLPDINIDDGLLDIVLLTNTDLLTLVQLASTTLLGTNSPPTLKRWKAKEFRLSISPMQSIICDDIEVECSDIFIKIVPQAINVVAASI
jgi:diacylglycerol kinase (ATP)